MRRCAREPLQHRFAAQTHQRLDAAEARPAPAARIAAWSPGVLLIHGR
jgi:hypothetical protein